MISELLAAASLGAGALSAGAQLSTAWSQGSILNQNANVLRQSASVARSSGLEEARQIRIASYKTAGMQRTAYGKSGLAVSGSLLDVMDESRNNYEFDAQKAIYQAELQARGMEYQATIAQYQAKVGKYNAIFGASASVLGAGVQAGSAIYRGRVTTPTTQMSLLG